MVGYVPYKKTTFDSFSLNTRENGEFYFVVSRHYERYGEMVNTLVAKNLKIARAYAMQVQILLPLSSPFMWLEHRTWCDTNAFQNKQTMI